MKLVKSLLLGSAAGLVAVAGASAADLGVKKPTAVEYVKTCPTYGAGFFVVPGTTSCLKLVGRVRADYIFNNATTLAGDKNTFRARGYVGYDHRTATEYGLLRTYVRAYIGRDNAGAYAPTLEYAFIQFGGLTVGRVTPVFEHGWNPNFIGSGAIGGHSDLPYVNSIGYTFNFGGGFSATLALDSANERRTNLIGTAYGGQALPDVVARLGYDASWGTIFVAGAVHQLRDGILVARAGTKYGFAGTVAAKIKLDMLSKGSNLWVNGTIAEGASSYTGFGAAGTVGGYTVTFSDATFTAAPNRLRLTRSWAITGGLQAYVSPTVWVQLAGSYAVHDPNGANNTTRFATVVGTVGWTPVAGFLIGGEVAYRTVAGRSTGAGAPLVAGAATGNDKSDWTGRIRFQRDF